MTTNDDAIWARMAAAPLPIVQMVPLRRPDFVGWRGTVMMQNCLDKLDVETAEDLLSRSPADVMAVDSAGRKVCGEIARLRAWLLAGRPAAEVDRYLAPPPIARSWQPISTAPKDGTTILVWCPEMGGGSISAGLPVAAYWYSRGNCWWPAYCGQGSVDEGLPDDPTHWRSIEPPGGAA
jgi:hypothetical protein